MSVSAIYAGDVVHARYRPRRHRLHYRVFALLLDLDELPALSAASRLLGYNRAAVLSFWDKDHGDGGTGTLRPWVEARLREAGLDLERPRISVLCYPRIFGYVFNPLTLYFCADRGGVLWAVLYEVCNTYGERHTYVIPAGETGAASLSQRAPKLHFVSPFVPMDCTYDFLIKPPADRVLVRIDESDGEGKLLQASFSGRRLELTDRALWRLLFAYPLMTLKVTVAIHWEAAKLVLKGMPVFGHPKAPRHAVSTHHTAGDRQPEPVRERS